MRTHEKVLRNVDGNYTHPSRHRRFKRPLTVGRCQLASRPFVPGRRPGYRRRRPDLLFLRSTGRIEVRHFKSLTRFENSLATTRETPFRAPAIDSTATAMSSNRKPHGRRAYWSNKTTGDV
ncbi:hypothetical protein EVAR_30787_1 [Eumeta japonica]|uniref:Uncharacterized protein n=1 Tax=Eumeta variegata TaxID=151549 RepID=A0A4C1V5X1_EUMVA|nr:hypothetical protein EVAR_30787_1 [Eumeta japonica]